jgi:hypothetical protein
LGGYRLGGRTMGSRIGGTIKGGPGRKRAGPARILDAFFLSWHPAGILPMSDDITIGSTN